MAYLFRPEVYLERALQAQEDIRDLMLTMDDFSEFVEAAAVREVRSATSDPVVALGSLVSASLPRDTHIQRLVAAVNQQSRASWTALYQEALERYGKRLNDGLKVEDFTRMAAMLTEGALAHSRSDPADVTSADMLAGIQLIVNAFVARTDALADNGAAMADAATLDQYRRHLVLNEKLTADERTLRILQQAHLDAFAYSNLDVMLGDAFLDLPNYLSRLNELAPRRPLLPAELLPRPRLAGSWLQHRLPVGHGKQGTRPARQPPREPPGPARHHRRAQMAG